MGSENLLIDSSERALHMASAIKWFADQLSQSESYQKKFRTLVEAICSASPEKSTNTQVHLVAVGKSGGVSQVFVSMLVSIGVRVRFLHPTEAFHGDLGSVSDGDVVICVSNFGRSAEILEILPNFKKRNCQIFCITAKENSPLGQACDVVITLPPFEEKCPLNQAPVTSTVTTLALCQLVVAATMEERAFGLESYARNHPGGAIGKRIFVRVDELMARGSGLPTVSGLETFSTCISKLTKFSLGAIVVVNGKKLTGIITEKNIRVAIESYGKDVFNKTANDLMTANPIVIAAGSLAIDALKTMENRPKPISVLPVVDEENNALGLLRIHDLVAEGITLGV